MEKIVFLCLPVLFLVAACGNSRRPGLSDKDLFAQRKVETLQETEQAPDFSDMENYVVPPGIKYKESRAVDPSAPPAVIDIVGNLNNKKDFKLSDIASSVRYIHLQHPPDTKFTSISDIVSDDEHIFVNSLQGLFCYSTEGEYIYTLKVNKLESDNIGTRIVSGILNNIDLLNDRLIYRTFQLSSIEEGISEIWLNVFDVKELDTQMLINSQSGELQKNYAQSKYQRRLNTTDIGASSIYLLMDAQSLFISNSLTGVTIYGDTLCKFNNFDRPAIERVSVSSDIYRINGQIILRKSYNDTVFRVIPPNRLSPAYVMNWGEYKPDMNQHAAGSDLEGKFVLRDWAETERFIFIQYTEGRSNVGRIAGRVLNNLN